MAMNLGLATDCWGDIPLREALNGLEGEEHYYPHFDAQQQGIQDIQTILDEAITLLSSDPAANETTPGLDDIIFEGDVNAYFDGSGNAQNQWWPFETNRGGYMRMGEYFINLMKGKNDPRLPLFALEINSDYLGAPMGETDPSNYSYVGLYFNRNDATLPLITYAEAKFIEAEARFRLGGTNEAE